MLTEMGKEKEKFGDDYLYECELFVQELWTESLGWRYGGNFKDHHEVGCVFKEGDGLLPV